MVKCYLFVSIYFNFVIILIWFNFFSLFLLDDFVFMKSTKRKNEKKIEERKKRKTQKYFIFRNVLFLF